MKIKWLNSYNDRARYQDEEEYLGWTIYKLVQGDNRLFRMYYAESDSSRHHTSGDNLEDIKQKIGIKSHPYQ